jgi:hemolysin D
MTAAERSLPFRTRPRDEREFLPAALEIVETPASPAGRAIAGAIIAFFVLALAWAVFGRVDIVATAPGKIVPTGRTKVIQPLDSGIVRAIHVQDGRTVKAGEVLVELDPTHSTAERNRLASELLGARLEAARLKVMLSDGPDPAAGFVAPPGTQPAQIALMLRLIRSAIVEFQAKLAALDRQAAQHEANRDAVSATVAKLEALLPLLRQQAEIRKTLYDREVGSKLAYIDAEQKRVEVARELTVQQRRLIEAEATLAAVVEQHREVEAGERRARLASLTEALAEAERLEQDLVKAEQRMREQTLIAPVDGVVQQLAVHTIGGVVTPAETLMVLVPTESRLEIEAVVANSDIGFVHAGQRAAVKVNTFPFTRYGLLQGEVVDVSPDAAAPASGAASVAGPPEPAREPGFTARISLDRADMRIGDTLVPLRPGMAVTVEINTGRRRVIEYLLSPLLRYQQETLRER